MGPLSGQGYGTVPLGKVIQFWVGIQCCSSRKPNSGNTVLYQFRVGHSAPPLGSTIKGRDTVLLQKKSQHRAWIRYCTTRKRSQGHAMQYCTTRKPSSGLEYSTAPSGSPVQDRDTVIID